MELVLRVAERRKKKDEEGPRWAFVDGDLPSRLEKERQKDQDRGRRCFLDGQLRGRSCCGSTKGSRIAATGATAVDFHDRNRRRPCTHDMAKKNQESPREKSPRPR